MEKVFCISAAVALFSGIYEKTYFFSSHNPFRFCWSIVNKVHPVYFSLEFFRQPSELCVTAEQQIFHNLRVRIHFHAER